MTQPAEAPEEIATGTPEEAPVDSVEPVKEASPEVVGMLVREPRAFQLATVRQLFTDAFMPTEGIRRPNPFESLDWCVEFCQDPTTAIVVAVENPEDPILRKFRGLCVIDWNPGPWSLGPWVLHYYATGTDARDAICTAARDWLTSVGQDRLYGLNLMGVTDKAHGRLFAKHFSCEKFASMQEFVAKG